MTVQKYLSELLRYRIQSKDTSPEVLEVHIPLLERLDAVDHSSVALFDMAGFEYRFLTNSFKFLHGYDPDEARKEGIEFFFDIMNEDDQSLFCDTTIKAFEYLYSLPPEHRKSYKICQDYRIRREDGVWIRMIKQTLVLELDRNGAIWLVLQVNDLSPLKDLDIPSRRYMEHIPSGKRVLFPPEEAQVKSPLTARQLEILGLIARGYHSQNIADYLGISVCTVNNHRQHILEKLEAANTAEAVSYAAELDLIDP